MGFQFRSTLSLAIISQIALNVSTVWLAIVIYYSRSTRRVPPSWPLTAFDPILGRGEENTGTTSPGRILIPNSITIYVHQNNNSGNKVQVNRDEK